MIATLDELRDIKRALIELTEIISTNTIVYTPENIQVIKTAYNVLDNAIIVNQDNVTLEKPQ
jgi:hypothetical protein